jgi:serine/threonine protein kinase
MCGTPAPPHSGGHTVPAATGRTVIMVKLCQDPTITVHHPPPRASGGGVGPAHPRAGQLLAGRYRLRGPVAHGAGGAVWRAYDERLARQVAAKQLADQHFRGLAEARIAARVRHPSVVTVHDVIRHEDSDWLVMNYHRGGTLADLLDRRRRLPPPIVAALGLQLLAALTAVHAAGVVHCDVKPANLLLGEDGRLILIDFGIAEIADNSHPARENGEIVGSPAYIAPELLRGEAPRPTADLWSLAATVYTAVEGHPPFPAIHTGSTLAAVLLAAPAPARFADRLAPLLSALLVKEPARRPSHEAIHAAMTRAYPVLGVPPLPTADIAASL